jgi:hypothetical protein
MAAGKSRDSADRLSLQTLVIASLASAAAALVTSQVWERGKVVTAALTPVIVAIVSELLHRPTERVRAVTTSRARGPAAPAERFDPRRLQQGAAGAASSEPRVYRPRRRLHIKIALVTGAVAFAIAVLALTVPELLAGSSVAGGGRDTTFFSGGNSSKRGAQEKPEPVQTSPDEQQGTETDPEQQVPTDAPTETQPAQPAPTETQPQETQTAPAPPGEAPPQQP